MNTGGKKRSSRYVELWGIIRRITSVGVGPVGYGVSSGWHRIKGSYDLNNGDGILYYGA